MQGRRLLQATAEVVVGVVEDELGGGRDDAVAAAARVGDDERIGPGFGIGNNFLALQLFPATANTFIEDHTKKRLTCCSS